MGTTDPQPRKERGAVESKFRWPTRTIHRLDTTNATNADFLTVLHGRRSIRTMNQAPLSEIAGVIRAVMRIVDEGINDLRGRYRKAAISAGAFHVIDALLIPSRVEGDPILYDDIQDQFFTLEVTDPTALSEFKMKASSVLPAARGDWIVLTADPQVLEKSYEYPESLLWRDAGAILQLLAMASFAKGLSFCPLGILGSEAIDAVLGATHRPIAVGAAAIGK